MSLLKSKKSKDINLISDVKEERPLSKKDFIFPLVLLLGTVSLLIIVVIGIFTIEQIEAARNRKLVKNTADSVAAWNLISDSAQDIDKIQKNLKSYEAASQQNINIKNFINKIRSDIPVTIKLTKISVDKEGTATVSGTDTSAKRIYQYAEILKENKEEYQDIDLKAVDYSAQERNYSFTINFTIAENSKK